MAKLFIERDDETGACTVCGEMTDETFEISGPYPGEAEASAQARRLVRFFQEGMREVVAQATSETPLILE